MRLDRLIANMGVGSRRDVKKYILSGAVKVNGVVVKRAEFNVAESDEVEAFGKKVNYRQYVYLMMNKPAGVISASEDRHGDVVAADLVGNDYNFYELSPAGRLDKDSEGFLLLTNDGAFIHKIISPNHKIDKVYYIKVLGELTEADGKAIAEGVTLGDGYVCLPGDVKIIKSEGGESEAFVTIHEGKFHQVKRMIAALGKKVTYLKRMSIGGVMLDEKLAPGEYRELTEKEMEILNEKTGN